MAHAVIDILEVVEVEKKDPDTGALIAGAIDGIREVTKELTSIGQLGQWIMLCEVLQFPGALRDL
jgi:hypothetical protein